MSGGLAVPDETIITFSGDVGKVPLTYSTDSVEGLCSKGIWACLIGVV